MMSMPSQGYGVPVSSMMMGKGLPPASMSMGQGMPPSTMMMSKGMPVSSMTMGKGMPTVQGVMQSKGMHAKGMHPGPQMPMMPIPWKQEEQQEKRVETPHKGFDNLSVEQLQSMAVTRAKTIESLEKELKELGDSESRHEQRLVKLENQFGALVDGKDLKFKAPLLTKIAQVVRDSHLLDHETQMDTLKEETAEEWAHVDPWSYTHNHNLALGRGFVGLDRLAIEKQLFQEQLAIDQHPVVHRMHYAGHIAKAAADVDGIFVKEAGVYKKQLVHPAPYRNQFWLNLDGPTREDAHTARDAAAAAQEDPVAQRVMRQNVAGTGDDAKAVDWLGKIKKGEVVDMQPPPQTGWRMPSWMY